MGCHPWKVWLRPYKVFLAGASTIYIRNNGRNKRPTGRACRRDVPRPNRHITLQRRSQMSNPIVLITGALTGIGRATALAFAREGARIVVSGRRDDAGKRLVTELRALGPETEFVRADGRRGNDLQNLADKTVSRFGRLDIAVNNSGTDGTPRPGPE